MAKRTIQECDLTKQEYDPDDTVKITIKKKGRGAGRSYELSPEAAGKLEAQLVNGPALSDDWKFENLVLRQPDKYVPQDNQILGSFDDVGNSGSSSNSGSSEDDKIAALAKERRSTSPSEELPEEGLVFEDETNACVHMNKGPIKTTLRGGKRFIYRTCTACGTSVPELPLSERELPSE